MLAIYCRLQHSSPNVRIFAIFRDPNNSVWIQATLTSCELCKITCPPQHTQKYMVQTNETIREN